MAPSSSTSPTIWNPRDRLTLRGRAWTVVQHTTYTGCETLSVEPAEGPGRRTFVLPFDRPRRLDAGRLTVVSPRAWSHAFATLLLNASPYGGLTHFPPTLDVVPYQLEPAIAMLRHGHPRLLIADDVGLGKTIEASLILNELAERDHELRALILVPAGLRQQWIDELATRFNVAAVSADAGWLRAAAHILPCDVNPWSPPGTYVASFDFVKRPEVLRPLEDVEWDLAVVDEVHAAAAGTDRRAAVDAVASRAHRVVLLTATPPADPSEMAALCRLGAAAGEPHIATFRRSRPDSARPPRRSVMLAVRPTQDERRMHRLLERYTTLVWREADGLGKPDGRLATTILRKRALSSAASLERSLRRRQELIAGACAVPEELQLLLPLTGDDEDGRDDTVPDDMLGARGLCDVSSERRWLTSLIAAAGAAAAGESKARVLIRFLSRIRQPAIVFTEYRDTLEQLRSLLHRSSHATCVLHGGLSASERRDALGGFAEGRTTLLATDAASEGLNLQRTCRIVVHYELPWNPSRMLQRAGRVDRIGQGRRVHEVALVAADTAESLVLAPLARRAVEWRGRSDAGRMIELLTESRVAHAVFEGEPPSLAPEPTTAPQVSINLTMEGAAEADRLQTHRRAGLHTEPARAIGGIPVTAIRRSALAPGMLLLFDVETAGSHGDVFERAVAAIHVTLAVQGWTRRSRKLLDDVTALLPSVMEAASSTVDHLTRCQLERVRPRLVESLVRMRCRKQSVDRLQESAARQLVQGGLFERPGARPRSIAQPDTVNFLAGSSGDTRPADGETELIARANLRAILLVQRR